jgi:hypothetical protein
MGWEMSKAKYESLMKDRDHTPSQRHRTLRWNMSPCVVLKIDKKCYRGTKKKIILKIYREKRLSIKKPQNAFEPSRVFKKRYKKFWNILRAIETEHNLHREKEVSRKDRWHREGERNIIESPRENFKHSKPLCLYKGEKEKR